MELQSSAPRFMALRLWAYVALFYQHLLKQKQLTPSHLLPPVLPIVLYNGEKPWTAPLALADLIQPVEGLARPSFEYVVLDASHYPAEELRPVEDVVSGVFLMEQVESLSELEVILDEIDSLVDDHELEQDIALLVSSVVGKLALKGEKIPRLPPAGGERHVRRTRREMAEAMAGAGAPGRTSGGLGGGPREGSGKGPSKGEGRSIEGVGEPPFRRASAVGRGPLRPCRRQHPRPLELSPAQRQTSRGRLRQRRGMNEAARPGRHGSLGGSGSRDRTGARERMLKALIAADALRVVFEHGFEI